MIDEKEETDSNNRDDGEGSPPGLKGKVSHSGTFKPYATSEILGAQNRHMEVQPISESVTN